MAATPPDELAALGGAIEGGLAAGAAGKTGELALVLGRVGESTRVRRLRHRSPLYVYAPIRLDPGRPDMAFVYLQQSGDGFVQGDRHRIDIHCEAGAAAHLTTQAATNVYAAPASAPTQRVALRADAGAVLEYLPDPLIPFAGARLSQRTTVTADPTATVIVGETLLPGRVARGEAHAYALLRSETEAARPDGTPLFSDLLRLCPGGDADPRSLALLGGHDVLATLYVLAPAPAPAAIVDALVLALAACPDVVAGATELPAGCGAVVRILGPTSATVAAGVHGAWDAARRLVLGVGAPDLRKG